MPETPILLLPYPEPTDPADVPADLQRLADRLEVIVPVAVGFGTTLPASPTDGQEFILVDSLTLPTYHWRLRYHAGRGDANKWELVGGPPLQLGPQGSVVVSTTGDPPTDMTGGPTFVIPRSGVYLVRAEAFVQVTGGFTAPFNTSLSVTGTVSGPVMQDVFVPSGSFAGSRPSISSLRGFTADETIKLQARATGAAGTTFKDGVLSVQPVRVQ